MKNIEEMLLGHYEIDPEYFIDRYNIKITGVKNNNFPNQTDDGEKKKPANKIDINIPVFLDESNDDIIAKADHNKLTDDLIRYVWDNPESTFSWDYFNALNTLFQEALNKGWKEKGIKNEVKINYDSEDIITKQTTDNRALTISFLSILQANISPTWIPTICGLQII